MEKEINKRKELHSLVLRFIDDDNDAYNFQTLTEFICDNNISKTKIDFQDFLHLLINLADNHHRGVSFFQQDHTNFQPLAIRYSFFLFR